MAKRLFTLAMILLATLAVWADEYTANIRVTETYDFKAFAQHIYSKNNDASKMFPLLTGDKVFVVNDGTNNRDMLLISDFTSTVTDNSNPANNIELDYGFSFNSRFAVYANGKIRSNNGLLTDSHAFSICNLKAGDEVYIEIGGSWTILNKDILTDETKPGDGNAIVDKTTYVVKSDIEGTTHLDLKSENGNSNLLNKVTITTDGTETIELASPTNQLTFDFTGNSGNLSLSDKTASLNAHESSTTLRDFNYVIPYSNKITPYGFFLLVKSSKATDNNYAFSSVKGLRITTDYFAINNLKAGDIIKVTQDVYTDNTSLVITNSTNEATNVIYTIDGSNLTKVAQNSTIASGEEFLVGKDGYVTFNINKGTVIKTIEITTSTTSTDETIAAPSITVDNTTATITPTTASNGSFTTTYFTTDGTPPNSESTAYTEPFNIDNSQGDVTIKAITYINGLSNKSDIASTVIEAASFDITVNQTTGGTFTVKVGDADVTDASTTAKYGQIITLDNTPAENYTFTTYSVTKTSGGEAVEVTNGSFTMPAEAVTVTAVFSSTATTLTSDNVSVAPVTYNGTEQTAVVKYNTTTLIKNTDYTITGTDALTNAGSTTFSITGTGSYSGIVEKTFTINKATLSATADDKSKTVGEENPELTVTVEGFVNEETSESLTTAGTYTAPTASTEATTESPAGEYAITVSGGSATNYNFSYVPGTLTILALAPSNPTLTIATELTGGSIAATPSGEVASGTSVTLTATPAAGYQLKNWKSGDDVCGDLPKSLVQTISMPENDLSITAEFEAQPETVPSISTSTLWTFDSFTPNTILSDKATYYYNGLYISGHNNGTPSNMATIKSGAKSTTIDEESVSVSNCLYLAGGNTTSRSSQEVNVFALDRVAFYTSVPGTVYVYMSGTKDSSRNFIIEANGTQNTTAMSANDTNPVLLTQTITAASKVYIGTSNGSCNIYAIKFVPTPIPSSYDITVTQPELGGTVGVKVGDAEVTTANTTATAGQTITLSNTPADNFTFTSYSVTKTSGGAAVEVTDGSFTMPAEGVTVTAVFEPTAHVHNFIYAVGTGDNTNILIATCQNPSCNLTDNKATLTLTADGGTYNGSAFSASTNLDAFNNATGLSATVSINYTGDNLYNSTDAPTNSGSYTATATVTIGGTDYILTKAFSISSVSDPTFNIQLPELDNGNNVLASHAYATAGTEITLTIVTATNYCLSSISVNNGVNLSGSGTTRTFIMPAADVTISATFTEITSENVDKQVTENVTVDNSNHATVTSVEVGASTTSVTISGTVSGAQVTSIEESAFSNVENKDGIKSVDLSATSITGVEVDRSNGVFKGFPEETMIYMPASNTAAEGQKNVIIGGTCSDFVMTDEKSYSIPTSFTATNATLSRSFTSGVTCTVCLPYAIPAENLGGKIYEFTSIEGTTVQMTEDTNGLDANKPYIFVPSAAAEGITASTVEVNMSSTPNTENTSSNFTFKGIYENKEFTSTDITSGVYGFAAEADYGASIGQFVKAASGASIKGMRAYLAYNGDLNGTSTASTRGIGLPEVLNVVLVSASGSTTNIGRLELMTAEDGSPVYNLNGQRVDSSYKGIVIKNGKKVVKK